MMEGSGSDRGEEAKTWDEMYSIDLMPSELFLKFREQIHGHRLGLNLEVTVIGAGSEAEAAKISRSVASSSLTKE
ncbi:hypothetical protein CTI12_AA214030 [Artemisia annua]|uniref:DUF7781 domain-containing protein n=1 Tax=Artemisia annua TaxID=35608 RepID=A0A2U1NYH6_ARTAN|nr:hypothetical protein CTI12_AA214030 [Artemisia annua]